MKPTTVERGAQRARRCGGACSAGAAGLTACWSFAADRASAGWAAANTSVRIRQCRYGAAWLRKTSGEPLVSRTQADPGLWLHRALSGTPSKKKKKKNPKKKKKCRRMSRSDLMGVSPGQEGG